MAASEDEQQFGSLKRLHEWLGPDLATAFTLFTAASGVQTTRDVVMMRKHKERSLDALFRVQGISWAQSLRLWERIEAYRTPREAENANAQPKLKEKQKAEAKPVAPPEADKKAQAASAASAGAAAASLPRAASELYAEHSTLASLQTAVKTAGQYCMLLPLVFNHELPIHAGAWNRRGSAADRQWDRFLRAENIAEPSAKSVIEVHAHSADVIGLKLKLSSESVVFSLGSLVIGTLYELFKRLPAHLLAHPQWGLQALHVKVRTWIEARGLRNSVLPGGPITLAHLRNSFAHGGFRLVPSSPNSNPDVECWNTYVDPQGNDQVARIVSRITLTFDDLLHLAHYVLEIISVHSSALQAAPTTAGSASSATAAAPCAGQAL